MNPVLDLLVICVCMLVAAFLSGIETGIISIHRVRLRHRVRQHDRASEILQHFLDDSDRLFGTTLIGTNIAVVTMSVLAASLAAEWKGYVGEVISTVVVTFVLLVFAEYLPKAWFHSRPLERCRPFAQILRGFELVLRPISFIVVRITRIVVPGPSESFTRKGPMITKEDLRNLVTEGDKNAVLSPAKRLMINRVFDLSGKVARQIMVPREKMTFVHTDTNIPDFLAVARSSKFTRMPVFDREKNQFVGIVNMFFVVTARSEDTGKTIAGFVRKPLLISHDTPVEGIFPRLRRSRQPMCLVTNEAGDVIGLLTTEDIFREVVGKL